MNAEYTSEYISLNPRDINHKGEVSFVKSKDRYYTVGQTLPAYVSGEQSVLEQGIGERVIFLFISSLFLLMLSKFYGNRSK